MDPLLLGDLLLRAAQCCLCCSKASNRHAEGRATDVVESNLVTELDVVRVATMLAADADFQVRIGSTTLLYCHLHELAYTLTVQGLEGVDRQDFDLFFQPRLRQPIDILEQEFAFGVVT